MSYHQAMISKALKVAIVSLGCPKNLIDSEKMLGILAGAGCVVGAPEEAADVIIVNTCAFLDSARRESLETIAEAVGRKRRGRARRVVVAGCLPSRDGRALYDLADGVDAVVGVNDRGAILQAVRGEGRITRLTPHWRAGKQGSDRGRFRLTPRHTAYLRIAEGCSRQCTFCTIPAIRGPLRSKTPAPILAEARELIADGAVELNLIAQDTTSYGRDLGGPCNLAGLLRKLDRLRELRWLRLMYTYPRRFTDDLIAAIAECPCVVHYVDLPLQHICDPILRRMGRGVSRKGTETLLAKLRRRIPDMAIRTTFIVGFPGETERQFAELLELVKAFRFEAAGVFEFSPERGTPAAAMAGQISRAVKAERARRLMLAQQEIAFAANRRKVGGRIEVLVDGVDSAGRCVGRHCGQAPEVDSLCILTSRCLAGRFVTGTVVGCDGYDLVVRPERLRE